MHIFYILITLLLSFIAGVFYQKRRNKGIINHYRKLAETDHITTLKNARAFGERFVEEWRRSKRNQTSLAFILMDIDKFKIINDKYGYQIGDELIRSFSEFLENTLRETDLVYRYKQGDEFAILIPGADELQAQNLIERLENLLEVAKFIIEDNEIKLEVSFAYTVPFETDNLPEVTIGRCEKMLRAEKEKSY